MLNGISEEPFAEIYAEFFEETPAGLPWEILEEIMRIYDQQNFQIVVLQCNECIYSAKLISGFQNNFLKHAWDHLEEFIEKSPEQFLEDPQKKKNLWNSCDFFLEVYLFFFAGITWRIPKEIAKTNQTEMCECMKESRRKNHRTLSIEQLLEDLQKKKSSKKFWINFCRKFCRNFRKKISGGILGVSLEKFLEDPLGELLGKQMKQLKEKFWKEFLDISIDEFLRESSE